MTEFKVPELGENVATGDVTKVLVNVGDTIAREQPVLELETDKATIEVPSSVAGVVKEIRVKKGDKVKVGAVVLTVDAPASGNGGGAAAAAAGREAGTGTRALRRPRATGSRTAKGRCRCRCGTHPSPRRAADADAAPALAAPAPPARADGRAAPASPAVRRLAREIGVNINDVEGTGPNGRISQDDVKEHARRILSSVGAAGGVGPGKRRPERRSRCRTSPSSVRSIARRGPTSAARRRSISATRGTRFRTSRSSTRRTSPRSKSCARGTRSRSRKPAAI